MYYPHPDVTDQLVDSFIKKNDLENLSLFSNILANKLLLKIDVKTIHKLINFFFENKKYEAL